MRGTAIQDHVVSVLEAFNFIGRCTNPMTWDETEASAVRLGQRTKAVLQSQRRGRAALRSMHRCAEQGTINLLCTDNHRRRVPYFQSPGFWLTAIYPDPVGMGDGMIELDDRYLHPCIVDIHQIINWRIPTRKAKTGPIRRFLAFDEELDRCFSRNPLTIGNCEVNSDLQHSGVQFIWPAKTIMHERINDARDRARARIRTSATPD